MKLHKRQSSLSDNLYLVLWAMFLCFIFIEIEYLHTKQHMHPVAFISYVTTLIDSSLVVSVSRPRTYSTTGRGFKSNMKRD